MRLKNHSRHQRKTAWFIPNRTERTTSVRLWRKRSRKKPLTIGIQTPRANHETCRHSYYDPGQGGRHDRHRVRAYRGIERFRLARSLGIPAPFPLHPSFVSFDLSPRVRHQPTLAKLFLWHSNKTAITNPPPSYAPSADR